MSQLRTILEEIHRRSLWQILGVYVAGGWVILQVIDQLTQQLLLPGWVYRGALIVLAVGLPAVLGTAIVQKGLRRSVKGGTGGLQRLFSWRTAIAGGIASFALLGLGTAGYLLSRTLGIGPAATLVDRGILEEREVIVPAEFQAASGDSALARMVTELVRIGLDQSPSLTLLAPTEIRATLQRMERDPTSPLDPALAREVAIRAGAKAYLVGDIGRAGESLVLTARLAVAETDAPVWSTREAAESEEKIFDAADRLSSSLRERVGESLRSVRRSPSLAQVTTSSMEALEKYSLAVAAYDERDYARAVTLNQEAIELDSTFAMAWAGLSAAYFASVAGPRLQLDAITRAYDYRDRLTDVERYRVAGLYHAGRSEWRAAIDAWETLLAIKPDDGTALNNIGFASYEGLGEFDRALPFLRRAVAAGVPTSLQLLPHTLVALGRPAEAAPVVEEIGIPWISGLFAASQGDYLSAREHFLPLAERRPPFMHPNWHLAHVEQTLGRYEEAEQLYRVALQATANPGAAGHHIRIAASIAELSRLRGDPVTGLAVLRQALERFPLESIDPLDRPYFTLTGYYARSGDVQRARELFEEFSEEVDAQLADPFGVALHGPRAWVALAEGRTDEAIVLLRELDDNSPCPICWADDLGHAFDRAGIADSTIHYYERYIRTPWMMNLRNDPWRGSRPGNDAWSRGRILERLGQLYDERGDLRTAAGYYAQLVELWADADELLQPRVRAARQRLEAIVAERA